MNTSAAMDTVSLALCRSALYEALAIGFRFPTQEIVSRLASAEGALALADAAEVADTSGAGELGRFARNLARGQGPAVLEALSTSHHRLFGHTARGSVSPYETEYGQDALFQQPQEMGDLGGFLKAFGFDVEKQLASDVFSFDRVDAQAWKDLEEAQYDDAGRGAVRSLKEKFSGWEVATVMVADRRPFGTPVFLAARSPQGELFAFRAEVGGMGF